MPSVMPRRRRIGHARESFYLVNWNEAHCYQGDTASLIGTSRIAVDYAERDSINSPSAGRAAVRTGLDVCSMYGNVERGMPPTRAAGTRGNF